MADIFLDFEWYRDSKGYELVPWKSLLRPGDPPDHYPSGDCIVANGGKWIPYRPLDQFNSLYLVFAGIKTSDDLLNFIKNFGPLTRGGFAAGDSGPEPVRGGATWADDVSSGLRSANFFRNLLLYKRNRSRLAVVFNSELRASVHRAHTEAYERAGETAPAKIEIDDKSLSRLVAEIDLVVDPEKGVRFRMKTDVLIAALWWQLGQKLSSDTIVRECRHCGELFRVGPGTKIRADATFCCREHSVLFHSLRRSKGT